MLQFFSTAWRIVAGTGARRRAKGRTPSCQAADLLAHPAIARMSERELADLPFPRDPGDARPPRPPIACQGAR
jgi:hypothetical protein